MVDAFVFRAIPVYHAQIGINDTPITRALEEGQFKLAQQLILENTDRSYLDEGPFVKIPLALVLSGDPEFRKHQRHLGLAKLLVERGANPNLRIPTSELQRASPSPMEYLINLLSSTRDVVLQQSVFISSDQSASSLESGEEEEDITNPLRTIGLNGEEKLSASELREQLLMLLDVFLANGGDPNVTTGIANSTLFHIVLSENDPDMEVALKLCEAGGNLNIPNGHGTTPLMDVISYADGDAALDILQRIWDKNPDISSLESQNSSNETALWRAMLAGSPQLAMDLLHRGADPGHRAKVYAARWHRLPSADQTNRLLGVEATSNGVSALYAPLLQQSSPYINHSSVFTHSRLESIERPLPFNVNLMNKVMACAVYPVVDNTYTSELFTPNVLEELEKLLSSETKFDAQEMLLKGITMQEIGILLFGHVKAGLQQLCVRQILHHILFEKPLAQAFELLTNLKGAEDETKEEMKTAVTVPAVDAIENWDDDLIETDNVQARPTFESSSDDVNSDLSECSKEYCGVNPNLVKDHWNLIHKLCPSVIHKLVVSVLNLPTVLVPRFEIEAARLQFGASMYTYEHVGSMVDWEGMSYEGSTEQFWDIVDDGDFDMTYASDSYDEDVDDDSDYCLFVRHPPISCNSFPLMSSVPTTSSSDEDILYPCNNESAAEVVRGITQARKTARNVSSPSEYSEVDQNSLDIDAAKDIHESETTNSGNCSSGEQVPSSVRRDEYQKLNCEVCSCSTSSSETSFNNSASSNETTNSR
ncbi:uncharacterized protein LOC126191107 isoform X1 [Schistocerca cancellata]|uniref:uncharacterized protein LOC126191107 isoform X1 n=1 Tax=Schistocerca cancellata TaxID=274614 RepID=UPI0021191A76|nr:uncharacterized protein LOC126191107 isoform X1 [Schistocerca cancellata]